MSLNTDSLSVEELAALRRLVGRRGAVAAGRVLGLSREVINNALACEGRVASADNSGRPGARVGLRRGSLVLLHEALSTHLQPASADDTRAA